MCPFQFFICLFGPLHVKAISMNETEIMQTMTASDTFSNGRLMRFSKIRHLFFNILNARSTAILVLYVLK